MVAGSRLVLAPHADDEVMGCGGLLAKYPDSVVVVVAAPDGTRMREFLDAKRVLGYGEHVVVGLRDGAVGADMAELVGLFDGLLRRFRPATVLVPFPSMHQDHVAVYEAGVRACRLSMSSAHWFPPEVLAYDVAAYDLSLYPSDLRWNVFESLTEEQVTRKVAALRAYQSEMVSGAHPVNGVRELAHAVGAARSVPFAEQFALLRAVR